MLVLVNFFVKLYELMGGTVLVLLIILFSEVCKQHQFACIHIGSLAKRYPICPMSISSRLLYGNHDKGVYMWSDYYYYGYHKQLASAIISLEGSIKICTANSQGEWGLHVLFYHRV